MREAYLIRDEIGSDCIRSAFYAGGHRFEILERPWLNNARNQSCIPAGEYICRFMPRSASGKYKNCYHVTGVPGRSGVLIHNGNIVSHSRGCLIIGARRGILGCQKAVLNSRSALYDFVESMNKQDFKLIVLGDQLWNG